MKFFLIITILIFQGCSGITHKNEVPIKKNDEFSDSKKSPEIKPEVEVKNEISTKEIKENKVLVEAAPTKVEVNPIVATPIEKGVEKQSPVPPVVSQLKEVEPETAISSKEIKKDQSLSEVAPKEDISEVETNEAKIPVKPDKKESNKNPLPEEKPLSAKLSKVKPALPAQNQASHSDEHTDSNDVVVIKIPNKNINGTSTFSPEVIHIKAGQKIMWINEDDRTHFINKKPEFNPKSLKSYGDDDEDEDTKKVEQKGIGFSNSPLLSKGKKWVFQFKEQGTVSYYCFTHPLEMRGKIIVE